MVNKKFLNVHYYFCGHVNWIMVVILIKLWFCKKNGCISIHSSYISQTPSKIYKPNCTHYFLSLSVCLTLVIWNRSRLRCYFAISPSPFNLFAFCWTLSDLPCFTCSLSPAVIYSLLSHILSAMGSYMRMHSPVCFVHIDISHWLVNMSCLW